MGLDSFLPEPLVWYTPQDGGTAENVLLCSREDYIGLNHRFSLTVKITLSSLRSLGKRVAT